MRARATLALLSIAVVSCSNPLPFGPGRVAVTLEDASVRVVENQTLFSDTPETLRHVPRQVLQLRISSRTDLLKYFEDWDRHLQVRCSVEGSANGKVYENAGYGPRPERIEHGGASRGPYQYTVYAFVDLEADDAEYDLGKPATKLDLKVDHFESVGCHLIGVQKAPVLFPRSNDFVVSGREFHDLLRNANIR